MQPHLSIRPVNREVVVNPRYIGAKLGKKLLAPDPISGRPLHQVIRVVEIRDPTSEIAARGIGFDASEIGNGVKKPGIYTHFFPNPNEAEPTALIRERLGNMNTSRSSFDDHPFMALAVVHNELGVIAYTQASVLAAPAMVYWQYGAVADAVFSSLAFGKSINFQAHGIGSLMYAARHTVLEEHLGRPAAGTVLEAEFRGQSTEFAETGDASTLRYTSTRLAIHEGSGAMGIICVMPDGTHIPFWKQPPLNEGRVVDGRTFADGVPYMLHMAFRPADPDQIESDPKKRIPIEMPKPQALALIDGLVKNFRLEGFDQFFVSARRAAPFGVRETVNGVELTRRAMTAIVQAATRVLLVPLSQTKSYFEYAMDHAPLAQQVRSDFEGHRFAQIPLAQAHEETMRLIRF